MRILSSLLLFSTALVGCAPRGPAGDAALGEAESAVGANLSGPVLEQVAASPYLYLRLQTAQGEVWAAVPEGQVEDGAVVTVSNPMLMTNFESSALHRTFDAIYFGTLGAAGTGGELPSGHPDIGVPAPAAPVEVGVVARATGTDARTVAETWEQRAALAGKPVAVRGVVVKYLEGVMGKNWIHLQDGSGDAGTGTNDLTVVTLDVARKGETVTIRGTVRTNVDFGMGYQYPVLVEEARVVRP